MTMQVFYLKGKPIQHPGVLGRELPMVKSALFTSEEADKMFHTALIMDKLFNNLFRTHSIEEAYSELKIQVTGIKGPNPERDRRIIRRVRSYILEYDIFLKHWEKYFADCVEDGKQKYREVVSNEFDNNDAYALMCTLRNYLAHSDDIVHGQHIGFDNFKIWASWDRLIQDLDWPKAKKELLQRQPEKIDILQLIDDSLPPIKEVHEKFMDFLLTEKVKESWYYLNQMYGRTIPIKASAWYVFDFKGQELVPGCPTKGVGADYIELNWQGYRAVKDYIESRENGN